jgi:steroid delta-isomerase-like uncharacterized protein
MKAGEQVQGFPTYRAVIAFNEALNSHDVEAMMRLLTPDCVFENTYPPPDGTRYEGSDAIRAFWDEFFRSSTEARIEIEELIEAEDRCVMRWIYRWTGTDGTPGHIRGVDVYAIRDGLIAEKLSYVKG